MWGFLEKNMYLKLCFFVLVVIVLSVMINLTMSMIHHEKTTEKYSLYLDDVKDYGSYNRSTGNVKHPMICANIPFIFRNKIDESRLITISSGKDFLNELGISISIVINLDISPEKLERVIDNMKNSGITNIKKMRGFNGKKEIKEMEINLPEFSVHDEDGLMRYQDFIKIIDYDKVGTGQQGCACSHLYIWKYIVQHKIPYTAIFEDDVCFHPQFKEMLTFAWSNRPKNGVLFNIGCANCDFNKCKDYETPTWVSGAHKTASFYILTLEGAKSLLSRFSKAFFPIIPCIDDMPFLSLKDSYKLYYNNKNVFKDFPLHCGNRRCGIITTPNSESSTSSIKFINKITLEEEEE